METPLATPKNPTQVVERERVGERVTIFRTSRSPKWYIEYTFDRQQIRRSLQTMSKKQARILAEKKNLELVHGITILPVGKSVEIDEAGQQYLRAVTLRGISQGTITGYRRHIGQFAAYARSRGITRLERVDAAVLEDYQVLLTEEGLGALVPLRKRGRQVKRAAPKTVRDKLKTVRQLIKWAVRRKLLSEDPSSGYSLPSNPKKQAYCWSPAEVQAIREKSSAPWTDIFDFLAMTGLRADELCWLLKSDVRDNLIQIRAKACPLTGKNWKPKHGRERVVPLPPLAVEIARRATKCSPGGWLFWSPTSRNKAGRILPHLIWLAVKQA
ncbi:MAG TPA: site-specific integrase, partial [Pirellulales bacterium]|nr:site-specific integrase [Pirellulales bacterium]